MDEKVKRIIKEFGPLLIVIVVVLLIKNFIITPIQVNGDSMYPTLKDGDIMILNKIGKRFSKIKRFDFIVIKHDGTMLIKRVIGLPGEKIEFKDNVLYVDGEKVEQDFLDKKQTTEDFIYNVEEDCYFALGDNRRISLDSRDLGCFDYSEIQGTTSLTLFPFNRLGSKK